MIYDTLQNQKTYPIASTEKRAQVLKNGLKLLWDDTIRRPCDNLKLHYLAGHEDLARQKYVNILMFSHSTIIRTN